jgi:ppGpp synthetase/RelA/SpoT-type nucleotidyltranferase
MAGVGDVSQQAASAGTPDVLTDPQIDQVIEQYLKEIARYESASRHVEGRLRRELREAAIPVLLSSRAKHPEDLREKLRRKRADPRDTFDALRANIDRVATDVAGVRVIVYDPRLCEVAAGVVLRAFSLCHGANAHEVHDKVTGYKATRSDTRRACSTAWWRG